MKIFPYLLPACLLLGSFGYLEAANILCLVGTAKHNNPKWSQPLFDALVARGHQLMVVSTAPAPRERVDGMVYFHVPNEYDVMEKHFTNPEKRVYKGMSTLMQLLVWYEVQLGSCRALVQSNTIQSRLAELFAEHVTYQDLLITDITQGMDCLLDLFPEWHYIPVIGLSGGKLTPDLIGLLQAENTINAATTPHFLSPMPKQMGFWNRMHNHIMFYGAPLVRWLIIQPVLSGIVDVKDVYPHLQLVLLNTHPTLDYVQNLPPGVIEVAGLHIKSEVNPLPNHIKMFNDRFIDGIVYIDLPYIELMFGPDSDQDAVIKMIESNPRSGFIWNVAQMKLFPPGMPNLLTLLVDRELQQDILGQPEVKGFLNHGDSLSIQEAVYYGVPMVVLPLKLVEFNNAQRVMERGLGVVLEADGFNTHSLSGALQRILNEEHFTSTLYLAQHRFRARPVSALELAVWHVEEVIEEPLINRHLPQPEAYAQNFLLANSLDVLAGPILIFLVVAANVVQILFHIYALFGKKQAPEVKKEESEEQATENLKDKESDTVDESKNITLKEVDANITEDLDEEIPEEQPQLPSEEEKPPEEKKTD